MRSTLRTAILAALISTAIGCSQYDRELMGEPQPKEPVNPAYAASPPPATEVADTDSMDVGMFNDLDYYGQWYQRDPYGWVWRPNVVMDWQPFTHGHWIWTQYGWMWVDYDPWGWATSHYGYWTTDFTLGWIWVPDYTWSPVQCDWIEYGNYIGWCPVAPAGAGFKDPWQDPKPWVWVPVVKFKQTDVGTYRAAPKFKPGTDTDISRGAPALKEIERKGAGLFPMVDVTLDRRIVRDREFARVKYPPDQQELIAEHRTVSLKGGDRMQPAPISLSPPPSGGAGDFINNPGPTTSTAPVGPPAPPSAQAKSKDSSSKPASSGKTETKYKSQKTQEKKDSGKSKDDSKTSKKGKG